MGPGPSLRLVYLDAILLGGYFLIPLPSDNSLERLYCCWFSGELPGQKDKTKPCVFSFD